MSKVQQEENTQRVISKENLISDLPAKPMERRKKIIIGVAIFIAIAAIVGTAVGLYFHYKPNSTHVQTVVSTTSDGTVHSSTTFIYTENNINSDNTNQTFTVMFAGLNNSQTQRRMLQTANGNFDNVDTTLHYTHESGFQLKFRNHEVVGMNVPIDQIVEYLYQQEDDSSPARLLDQDLTNYPGQDDAAQGSDIYESYRQDLLSSIQDMYPGVKVNMNDLDYYELEFDENSGKYRYVDNSTTAVNARRRLWGFKHFFHKIGSFFKRAATDVVHFVKKDGPKILKYGAIAALAGIDIAAKGPSGISDAVKMFKSGNVLTALQMTAEGVATRLPPYLSIPIEFIGQACFSHPPKMHCTKQAAIKAVKDDVIGYVKKHAISTIVDLLAE